MEMQFLTLLKSHNDFMDWRELWFPGADDLSEPDHFPCYATSECVDWEDVEEEGDCKGDALFAPHFLYHDDVEEMLENLE